jgi:hypothetical protein
MTQEDAENEGTRGWRTKAGWFLHELGTLILIAALVGGILLFLLGVLLASDPLFADSAVLPIMLGLLLVGISIAWLVARR